MFTGLIEDVGTLLSRKISGSNGKLQVKTKLPIDQINIGDSIAVNGTCLTVEASNAKESTISFHVLSETLQRTNLGSIPLNTAVNLEQALCLGDRLGGHLVSGHIDCTSKILDISKDSGDIIVKVKITDTIRNLIIPKGSIALNGVSLTIATLQKDNFSVHLIPHSWQATNISKLKIGDSINIEADMVGKYILRQQEVPSKQNSINMNTLNKAGFF